MASVIQEIGIPIDLSKGVFINTVYKDGALQLVEEGVDDLGQIVYAAKGEWESDPILIKDKIKAFKNVVKSIVATGAASMITSVATSDDGITWSDYIETDSEGKILNTGVKKFAKVKIELFASKNHSEGIVDSFTSNEYRNEYVELLNSQLKLKKEYALDFVNDSNSNYHLKKFAIDKSKYKSIKRLRGE